MNKAISSRDFNQDTAAAKRAAKEGPVFITDRGRPAYVLMTMEDYRRLSGGKTLGELIGMSEGDDIEFEPARMSNVTRATPFEFD
jgi:prevent-host-death family protein